MSEEGMFIVSSRWFRLAEAGPDQRRQLRFEIGRHGWPEQFCEKLYNALTVQKTNASRRPGGPERDKPNLTAELIHRPCPNVRMKRPEAGSTPACTTQPR